MAKPVVIVDSEAKAITLQAQFAGEIDSFVVQAPPVRISYKPPADKLKRETPRFSFIPIGPGKGFIDKLSGQSDREIYLAFDCDQRGEYLAWMISQYLLTVSKGSIVPRRFHVTALNRDELESSFRLVEPVNTDRAMGHHIRSMFNLVLGKHLERLLGTRTGPSNLPLNYYSLAALALLAEREAEIKAFSPVLKWRVGVKLATAGGKEFAARLVEVYGISDDGYLRDSTEAREAVSLFKDQAFTAAHVTREDIALPPPLPYHLAELLQDAFILHGMQPKKVLEALRKLFAGVQAGDAPCGLITAFVGGGQAALDGIVKKLRDQVVRLAGADALGPADDPDGMTDAVLPTRPDLSEDDLGAVLDEHERSLYGLIRSRALASQMKRATGQAIDVEVVAGEECLFRAGQRTIADKGYLAVYQGYHDQELLRPSSLADVQEGEALSVVQIVPEQTGGVPPEFYTFESLFADLADFSIPLDAMTILMLQSMINGGYLAVNRDGSLRPAENAAKVIATVNRAFPSMEGMHLPAYCEQTVQEVVSGRKSLALALQQFDQTLMMRGEVLVKVAVPATIRRRARHSASIIKAGAETESPGALRGAEEEAAREPAAGQFSDDREALREEESAAAPQPAPEAAGEEPAAGNFPAAATEEEPVPAPMEPADGAAPAETGEAPGTDAAEEMALTAGLAEVEDLEEELAAGDAVQADAGAEAAEAGAEPQAGQEIFEQPPAVRTDRPSAPEQPMPGEPETEHAPARACPDCGRPLLLKEDRFGKYWFCSGHPACRHSESFEKGDQAVIPCPLCRAGKVVTKRTPTGKIFYVCPEEECEFMAWSRPHAIACPLCGSPFLVEKSSPRGRSSLRCPRAGCSYSEPLAGGEGAGAPGELSPSPRKKVRVRRVAKGASGGTGGKKRLVRVVRRKS